MIIQALLNSGYHPREADAALMIMQSLALEGRVDPLPRGGTGDAAPARCMTREERARFTPEAFSFVLRLSRLGMISEEQREEILEKALAVYAGRIMTDQVRTLVAVLLFTNETSGDSRGNAGSPAGRVWN